MTAQHPPAVRLPVEDVLGQSEMPAAEPAVLGRSRRGRPLLGYRLGTGPLRVSLVAGCHADEPVGPAMLRRLVAWLAAQGPRAPALARVAWRVVPHANPDGALANAAWPRRTVAVERPTGDADRGFELLAYLEGAVREPPGDDVEFGFPRPAGGDPALDPAARPENRALAAFLAEAAPLHLHASFHGMAFATGPWFLLEPTWVGRTTALRTVLARRTAELGYRLEDVDRGGEKGFFRIAEGFSTRPDSGAMRDHFLARGEPGTAARFRPSSMETARALGGDPLTLVSEMPLFLVPPADPDGPGGGPGEAAHHPGGDPAPAERPPRPVGTEGRLAFAAWAHRRLAGLDPEDATAEAARHGVRPMPLGDQMRLQLALLEQGLAAAARFAGLLG
jgi:hypothetical protein